MAWVGFRALYGQGASVIADIASFGAVYMAVVLIEPVVDLALLAGAKSARWLEQSGLVAPRPFA